MIGLLPFVGFVCYYENQRKHGIVVVISFILLLSYHTIAVQGRAKELERGEGGGAQFEAVCFSPKVK